MSDTTTPAADLTVRCASDLHGQLDLLDPTGADICVLAGDIAPLHALTVWDKRHQETWMRTRFFAFVGDHPATTFVFIAGNHDFWGEKWAMIPAVPGFPSNARFLFDDACTVKGIRFWGSSWVPYIGTQRRWAFERSERAMAGRFAQMPDGLDVLITHTPPLIEGSNIDSSGCYIDGERTHFGAAALTAAILAHRPRHLVCGHVHTGDHAETRCGDTRCHNVSLLDEAYRPAYKPLEIIFRNPLDDAYHKML